MNEIKLYGKESDLISILESHITYLEATGYEDHTNNELGICREFLMQLDPGSDFIDYHEDLSENNEFYNTLKKLEDERL